jgi:hypothetical protein
MSWLRDFSLTHPIFPPVLAEAEMLNKDTVFSKPISFILFLISINFLLISSLFSTS